MKIIDKLDNCQYKKYMIIKRDNDRDEIVSFGFGEEYKELVKVKRLYKLNIKESE